MNGNQWVIHMVVQWLIHGNPMAIQWQSMNNPLAANAGQGSNKSFKNGILYANSKPILKHSPTICTNGPTIRTNGSKFACNVEIVQRLSITSGSWCGSCSCVPAERMQPPQHQSVANACIQACQSPESSSRPFDNFESVAKLRYNR